MENFKTNYLEVMHHNANGCLRTFADTIHESDQKFYSAIQQLPPVKNKKQLISNNLAIRAFGSFRAATALILGGNTYDCASVIRNSLEASAYSFLTLQDQDAFEMLNKVGTISRSQNDKRRKALSPKNITNNIEKHLGHGMAAEYKKQYDFLIEFGAHPNPNAIFTNVSIEAEMPKVMLLNNEIKRIGEWLKKSNNIAKTSISLIEYN